MAVDPRLSDTISEYLCTECKTPLYVEVGSEDRSGVCTNHRCILHIPGMEFYDVTEADRLSEEMLGKEAKLHQRITETDRAYFVNYLYEKRLSLIKSLLETSRADFKKWLAIDDLLICVSSNPPKGRQCSLQTFESILSDYCRHFDRKCFIEDLENKRYLVSTDKKAYVLKYWPALLEFYETHGIVAGLEKADSEMFRYDKIEKQVKENVELVFGDDWGKYFQQMFDFIINLGYMFEYQYFTAKQHRYDPTGIDITTLLGLWMSVRYEVETWSGEGIRRHFDRTSKGSEDFEKFYEKYVSGQSLAPVIVFNGETYLFDKYATLLYSLYLMRINQRMSIGQTKLGTRDIAAKREEASCIFEEKVREQLRRAGFMGPSDAIRVREQSEEHEYDAIGVNEAKSQVVIAEAKYRDFSPSSISGKTLVNQELLDEDKFLDWVSDAQSKLEFFRKHGARFERELLLHKNANVYGASVWVVTKHRPLISKYRSVQVVDFQEFCRIFPSSEATG